MQQLDPTIESFYKSILEYAGLEVDEDNNLYHSNESLGEFTVNGNKVALPYFNELKNPKGRVFFHLLNESFTEPETTMFEAYKDRLILNTNFKLGSVITSLIAIASEPRLQKLIRDPDLEEMISKISEADMSIIPAFLKMSRLMSKEDSVGYLFDIFLKKGGKINGESYSAIGKINFKFYKELKKNIDNGEWKFQGTTFRKKDLICIYDIFNVIFPNIEDEAEYTEGTINNIFRYLNILLKTNYIITSRINDISEAMLEIKHESILNKESISDHEWTLLLPDLYHMAPEIRLIPNQTDIIEESTKGSNRLVIDESKAVEQRAHPQPQPTFNPNQVPAHQMQPQPTQEFQQPMSAEDIIRSRGNPGMNMHQLQQQQFLAAQQQMMANGLPGMQPANMPGVPNMVMHPVPNVNMNHPSWVVQEHLANDPAYQQTQAYQQNLVNQYQAMVAQTRQMEQQLNSQMTPLNQFTQGYPQYGFQQPGIFSGPNTGFRG